jgi:nucleotide-binding universal stress UspA family protein
MEPTRPSTPPRKLLLATDLSGRCDRALDRAVNLNRRWGAQLTAVHALELAPAFIEARARQRRFWHTAEDRTIAVARQLQADIDDDGIKASVVVEAGDPADLVLRTAESESSDLILTGHARAEPFGRLLLGATVERLVRHAAAPVLVVRGHDFCRDVRSRLGQDGTGRGRRVPGCDLLA